MKLNPQHTITKLMQVPRGILAADESNKTAGKRLLENNIKNTEENRRLYRQMLFTTPHFNKYVSGVILYDETLRQSANSGERFSHLLSSQGVLVGIKVDGGLMVLPKFNNETITTGLDELNDRLKEYVDMGACFTKWRAAFEIDHDNKLPSSTALHANLHAMALYALLAQQYNLVPIVEPEILFAGMHSIAVCADTLSHTLRILFELLSAYKVDLTGVILKTSMVLAGSEHAKQSSPTEVADATLKVLSERVPHTIGGVVFLSGGQSPQQTTDNLTAIMSKSKSLAYPLTFSFSRALQEPALRAWHNDEKSTLQAQTIFENQLKKNSQALQ